MAQALKLGQFSPGVPDRAPAPSSCGSRLYQQLTSAGASSQCCQKVKGCLARLYGPPLPPLTEQEAETNYCLASIPTFVGALAGSLVTCAGISEAIDPAPNTPLSPALVTSISFLAATLFFSAAGAGLVIIHKTYKAPRIGVNQPLLSTNRQTRATAPQHQNA